MNTVGERIKYVRSKFGHNQGVAAKAIGISQGSLSDIESNHTKPSIETIISVYRNYNVSCDWLLTGEGTDGIQPQKEVKINDNEQTEPLTEKEIELLTIFEQIPEDKKDLAINVLKPFIQEMAATKENIEISDKYRKKRKPVLNKRGTSYSSTGTTDRYASKMNA